MQVLVPDHVKEELATSLRVISESVQVLPVDVEGHVGADPRNAEILLRYFPNDIYPGRVFDAEALQRVIEVSPKLRWIHNGMTGMDSVLYPELVASEIIVTNAAGAHRDALAETALGMMLAMAKRLREHLAYQHQHRWHHLSHTSLKARTVTIVGLGKVGEAIAQRCKAFGMRVTGVKRRLATSLPPTVDRIETPARLHALLAEADYVIITAALTPETRGMIGEAELRMMQSSAYLINIARGAIVDEQALVHALREGWIAGACLDVFEEEPLPQSSPLWSLPNVIVTPHNAAWSSHVQQEALDIFLDNVRRYITGQPLCNVVDKQAGY